MQITEYYCDICKVKVSEIIDINLPVFLNEIHIYYPTSLNTRCEYANFEVCENCLVKIIKKLKELGIKSWRDNRIINA